MESQTTGARQWLHYVHLGYSVAIGDVSSLYNAWLGNIGWTLATYTRDGMYQEDHIIGYKVHGLYGHFMFGMVESRGGYHAWIIAEH